MLSHRAARQGLVGKRTEGEQRQRQRQRQGNFAVQEQEGRGGMGRFVRSMSWLWPRASMDDSHAAITDLEAIPTCHHKHRNQATTHVSRLDGWGGWGKGQVGRTIMGTEVKNPRRESGTPSTSEK